MPLHTAAARLFGLALFTLALCPLLGAEPDSLQSALDSISSSRLEQHAYDLSDDTFEGREAGSPGGHAAATYLLQQLQGLGLNGGAGENHFYQAFRGKKRNILAILPGSDPELQHEFLLIGAHYDHVGYGNNGLSRGRRGYIHNGADDNASGLAGSLEIAQALSHLDRPPKRSVLFAFWDGEEKGMLGSKHWLRRPTVALEHVVATLNLDMIGRLTDQGVEVLGIRTAYGWRKWLCQLNTVHNFQLQFPWQIEANSDHWPFYQQGIPTLMLHTGLHDDYHRPTDDAHLLNFDGLRDVTQFALRCAWSLANEPQPPAYRRQSKQEGSRQQRRFESPLKSPPPRLGISWSPSDPVHGLLVTQVTPGTPARAAGLRIGDRITAVDERPILDHDRFREEIRAASKPLTLNVLRNGASEPAAVQVKLAGKPLRLGISWRADAAAPGVVMLVRVAPHSPGGRAGLQVHDRLYEMNGRTSDTADDFLAHALETELPITFLVERGGQFRTVTLRTYDDDRQQGPR